MNIKINKVLHKEIDLIQANIKRMADCSFRLKNWYISLITIALTLLLGQRCELSIIALLLLCVTTIFWGLDGFFLRTETLYRWKYEWVIEARLNENMDNMYDLNPYNKEMWKDAANKDLCIMKFIFSRTLFPLYGIVWIIAVVVILYII